MRYLTIIRHAKSSWDDQNLPDHERPLNERGLKAAPAVARFLYRTYFGGNGNGMLLAPPDRVVSSTANRAFATAQIMQETCLLPKEALQLDSRLYLAAPEKIMEVARGLDERWWHVCLVGHNPGLHEFADRLLARTSVRRMPTCTAVIVGLPHEYWGLTDWREAQLIAYVTPKALERRFPAEYAGISKEGPDD